MVQHVRSTQYRSRSISRCKNHHTGGAISNTMFFIIALSFCISSTTSFKQAYKSGCNMVHLKEENFGTFKNETVKKFTWYTDCGFSLSAISYGAIIQSIKMPDKNGDINDIVLGFDDLEAYLERNDPYFGAAVGRCANRIAKASYNGLYYQILNLIRFVDRFTIDDVEYKLYQNVGENHLHGGKIGFDKVNWKSTVEGNKVHFSYYSKDGEENYPGDLITTVTYELKDDLSFIMEFISTTNKKTVVNLTNHSYFNLAGHETGAEELYNHFVAINADKITETDSESIPTGRFTKVGGTPYDLRTAQRIGDVINNAPSLYDDNFCVNQWGNHEDLSWVSRVYHPPTGRSMEIYSNQPGVQFYTANGLPSPDQQALIGKDGVGYRRHGALCLETQNYPDAVHHDNFPSPILKPGHVYRHNVVYKFGVEKD